nr:MAG TPA: hypothetical protein [Caudoviricetes sp.]
MEPLRAVVKADLTKELILLTSADLCQRLKEEVALTGDRLINGSQNAQVQQQSSTGRKVLAKIQVDNADGRDHAGQRDTVDVTGSGNHGQTVLNSVSVDLEHGHSVTPQAQAIGGSVSAVNLLHHVGNIPQAEGLGSHRRSVGSDCGNQTTGLIDLGVISGLVVDTVNEGVLNVGIDLHHLGGNLKVQLIHGVGLLTRHIDTAQSTHVRHLPVGNAHRLLKDLSHIGLLRTGHNGSVRGGQRSTLANSRLSAAARGELLTGHELNMVRGLGTTTDDGTQRGAGVALVKEHTGVIEYPETHSKLICHSKNSPLLFFRLRFRFGLQAGVVSNGGEITVCPCFLDFLGVIHLASTATGTGSGLGGLFQSVSLDLFCILVKELLLVGKHLGRVTISHRLCGILSKNLVIALSNELGLKLGNTLGFPQLGKLLLHVGELFLLLLLLLLVLTQQSVVLTLPLSGFGVGLGNSGFLLFQLGGVVLILERFQSFQLVFRRHFRIARDFAGVDLCHNDYLLRLTRLFTQHYFLFLRVVSRLRLRSSLTIQRLTAVKLLSSPFSYLRKDRAFTDCPKTPRALEGKIKGLPIPFRYQ